MTTSAGLGRVSRSFVEVLVPIVTAVEEYVAEEEASNLSGNAKQDVENALQRARAERRDAKMIRDRLGLLEDMCQALEEENAKLRSQHATTAAALSEAERRVTTRQKACEDLLKSLAEERNRTERLVVDMPSLTLKLAQQEEEIRAVRAEKGQLEAKVTRLEGRLDQAELRKGSGSIDRRIAQVTEAFEARVAKLERLVPGGQRKCGMNKPPCGVGKSRPRSPSSWDSPEEDSRAVGSISPLQRGSSPDSLAVPAKDSLGMEGDSGSYSASGSDDDKDTTSRPRQPKRSRISTDVASTAGEDTDIKTES